MDLSKSLFFIRCLLLICAICATSSQPYAQTVSQIVEKSAETGKIQETDEAANKVETKKEINAADEDELVETNNSTSQKQSDPKPARFGGHVGVVIPIVTRGNNRTTTIADGFIIGFPFALTVKTNSPAAFDLEFVPIINTPSNQDFRFLVHPGIVYSIRKKYAVGVRGAYEFGTGSYGFTPIVNRSFKLTKKTNYFIEADFPVRWERRPNRTRFTSIQFAIHSGISF